MGEQNNDKSNNKLGRRSFLKGSVAAGLGAAALGIGGSNVLKAATDDDDPKEIKRHKVALKVREYDRMDDIYAISPDYQRMRQKNTLFCRAGWDPFIGFGGKGLMLSFVGKENYLTPNPTTEGGDTRFGAPAHALKHAGFQGMMQTSGFSGLGGKDDGPFYDWERTTNPNPKKYHFKSPKEAAKYVKRAAKFLGASDAGIAPFDERWIYSKWYNIGNVFEFPGVTAYRPGREEEEEAVFPFKVKSVIVTVHEMDKDALRSPYILMDAAAGREYSRMVETGHKVSTFLNDLGYNAAPAGNDTSMSVPTALQAGLGENSRMGTLIHPKLGPGVRIGKIYTDLEIEPDKPITFGVQEFCRKCKKCADACPSQALSWDEEPSLVPTNDSISTHPGIAKWYQDNEKCFGQWEKFGSSCGVCLSVCPYNKPENWVHDVAKTVVGLPVGRDIARIMDDAFGYGKPNRKDVEAFWNKKD